MFYLLYAAGGLLHFIFRDICVGWAATRGGLCERVCVGGGGSSFSSNSVCIANGLILRPILNKDTVIKNHEFLFSGTRVKHLDH